MKLRAVVGAIAVAVAGCQTEQPASVSVTVQGVSDFGTVAMGSVKTRGLVVRNNGQQSVTLGALEVFGGDPAPQVFEVAATTQLLAPGETVIWNATFHPPQDPDVKVFSHEHSTLFGLHVKSDRRDDVVRFTLSGRSTNRCFLPDTIEFGGAMRGDTVSRRLLLANDSDDATVASITEPHDIDFALSPETPAGELVIQPRSTRSVQVLFSPSVTGRYSGSMLVRGAAGCPIGLVQLKGDGVLQQVACPDVDVGTLNPRASYSQPVVVTNAGINQISLRALMVDLPFSVSEPLTRTVPGATRDERGVLRPGSLEIPVTFSPRETGPFISGLRGTTPPVAPRGPP